MMKNIDLTEVLAAARGEVPSNIVLAVVFSIVLQVNGKLAM